MLYVQSPAVVRRLALSYQALAADVYWIRALQHFGGARQQQPSRSAISSCCTRCSTWRRRWIPHFNIAYRFGAIFLSEPKPGGPGPARPGD